MYSNVMPNKKIELSDADMSRLEEIDLSISHWSVELTKMVLSSRRLESTISDLYAARNKVLDTICKESGAGDIKRIIVSQNKNGKAELDIEYDKELNPVEP